MEGGFFMRKRLMASGLVVLMALGLMAGCNGKSSETEKIHNLQKTAEMIMHRQVKKAKNVQYSIIMNLGK